MIFKQGIALILLLLCTSAFAEEATYLVEAQSSSGPIQGAVFTNSNEYRVSGFVMLKHNVTASFAGNWTRTGKIEAVDLDGNVYLFDVIKLLNDQQARNFVHRF